MLIFFFVQSCQGLDLLRADSVPSNWRLLKVQYSMFMSFITSIRRENGPIYIQPIFLTPFIFCHYLSPRILCTRSPRTQTLAAGCPPWLGCPCMGSCTLGTLLHTHTSSRSLCRQTLLHHCRRCNSAQPGQIRPSGSLVK